VRKALLSVGFRVFFCYERAALLDALVLFGVFFIFILFLYFFWYIRAALLDALLLILQAAGAEDENTFE
jgi:hypothetical protein